MQGDFKARLATVRERLEAACARAGRSSGDVRLLAVTKTFGPAEVAEAVAAGLACFGESRVQEAAAKIPLCPPGLEWHMIGHLQRNKARQAARLFRRLHAVDSIELLEALERVCGEEGLAVPVLLEVNVSGEASKFGAAPGDLPALLERAAGLSAVRVDGLMTIPPYSEDPEQARPFFRRLRELRDQVRAHTGLPLPELSMGMSHDFEVAVEEGATWVRVGTILFGGRG